MWCTTGSQKRHLTVVLTVLADGVVLPALAIFKGKKQPKFHEVGVFIRAQEKAWMDESVMLEWIDLVWEPATEGRRALIVHDSFSAHLTVAIKQRLKEINTVPVVIPGGCTSKVQPLDVSINKPFKSYVRRYWSDYILEQPASLQTKKPKPPKKEDVASWISSALEELQDNPDMVVRSFDACGILNHFNSDIRADELLEGQLYPESADEMDDPFNEAETLMSDCEM